ncbi:MAG: hydrogenase maturation nickel metallochaperone HypA [Vicinamibacteria bacterium]|jgi:hydrogenase nickel incorporation protein HypA/HybF|nr:hydrogenase maturation nickel metallochaperone HypA [Vicinamibacteria bacterium]
MHELTITTHLLRLAEKHARQAGAARVTDIRVRIGALSTYVEEAVEFCFEQLSRGTICEGARLHVRRVPAILHCLDCGADSEIAQELVPCPRCDSAHVRVTAGDDLLLEAIEAETAEATA